MNVTPYLDFNGRAEEALEFYKRALGAEISVLMRYKDNPDACAGAPGLEQKILHCSFKVGSTELMCSDGRCTADGPKSFAGINLAIGVESVSQAEKCFGALSEGGTVGLPLTKTFFSPAFGVVIDRLGVTWMVVTHQK